MENSQGAMQNHPATRTICVTSGKGGVGKTTLSVNLGIAMAAEGHKVILLDGDLGLANVNVQLGIIPPYNILDVVQGRKTLEQIICKTSYGIDFIAGANGIAHLTNLGEAEQSAFMHNLESLTGYDLMLIDTGAGIGANVIRFVMAADDTLVVTTPEPTAIADAYGLIKTIIANGSKPIKLLMNRVASLQRAIQVAGRLNGITSRFMGVEFDTIGHVPTDPLIEKSIFQQRPHLISHPHAKSSDLIREVARHMLDPQYQKPTAGLAGFFQKVIQFTSW